MGRGLDVVGILVVDAVNGQRIGDGLIVCSSCGAQSVGPADNNHQTSNIP